MLRKGIQVVLLGIGSWLLISFLVCAFSGCSPKGYEAMALKATPPAATVDTAYKRYHLNAMNEVYVFETNTGERVFVFIGFEKGGIAVLPSGSE